MPVLAVIGLLFLLIGGSFFAFYYLNQRKVAKRIAAAQHWPEATAVVDVARVDGFTIRGIGTRVSQYRPVFSYRFQVGGQTFTGERVIFGLVKENSAAPVRKLLEPYQPGQWIKVRYNPYDPRDSVVELRQSKQQRYGFAISGIFAAIGLVLIVLGVAGVGAKVGGGGKASSYSRS